MKIIIPVSPLSKNEIPRKVYGENFKKAEIKESKKFKEYCEVAGAYLEPLNIGFGVQIKMSFYLPYKRNVSLIGLIAAMESVLVECNFLANNSSSVVISVDGSRVLYDSKFPRTELEITRYVSEKKAKREEKSGKNGKTKK